MTAPHLPKLDNISRTRATSRFAGRKLSDLFAVLNMSGSFDHDVWDLAGHPDAAGGEGKRREYFDRAPVHLRDALKEFLLLTTRPQVHAAQIEPSLVGAKAKDLKTAQRMIPGLIADLAWLTSRTRNQSLEEVTQTDFDALLQEFDLNYRRVGALQTFAKYCRGMSTGIAKLCIQPWEGHSGLSIGGGLPEQNGRNSTDLYSVDAMWPLVETAMLLVQHGRSIVDVANLELVTDPDEYTPGTRKLRNGRTRLRPSRQSVTYKHPDGHEVEFLASDCTRQTAQKTIGYVAASCAFLTVAFTGMRASEFEAVPRSGTLDEIHLKGARRPLLFSYLLKGREAAQKEQWLIPPVVEDSVRLMQYLLDSSGISTDEVFPPTGMAPLFDRRALASMRRKEGPTVMRLGRVIDRVSEASEKLSDLGLVTRHRGPLPNGRQLRRNLTIVVSSRPNGPQAAMEQFKWQSPETASGYFRVAPDAIAVGQRQVFQEVAELHADLVVDALRDEFSSWERRVPDEQPADFPLGLDGRRKRDLFAVVHEQMPYEPRVEEDERRLRELLRTHAENMHLTDFGWCDFDESLARCGGIGGPNTAMCDPYSCLNHSTPTSAVPAHIVKHDRLTRIGKSRSFPPLAREKASRNAEVIVEHLGAYLKDVE